MAMPAVITSGQHESLSDGYYGIPKRDLIVGLQVLLQQGNLQMAGELRYGPALAAEMAAMEVRVSSAGRDSGRGGKGARRLRGAAGGVE